MIIALLTVLLKSVIGCVPMGVTALLLYGQQWIQNMGIAGLLICVLASCIVYFAVEFLIRNEPISSVINKWKSTRK